MKRDIHFGRSLYYFTTKRKKIIYEGVYGAMGVHARNGITFTPETVVEIIEEVEDKNTTEPTPA